VSAQPGRKAPPAAADVVLDVRVTARAREPGIDVHPAGGLRMRIAAPAIDGRANAELVETLARAFAVPKAQVRIERGEQAPRKRVRIVAPRRMPAWAARAGT
jgi:hypothetical protein